MEVAETQISLPFNSGGCGLRRYAIINSIAYVASFAAAIPYINKQFPLTSLSPLSSSPSSSTPSPSSSPSLSLSSSSSSSSSASSSSSSTSYSSWLDSISKRPQLMRAMKAARHCQDLMVGINENKQDSKEEKLDDTHDNKDSEAYESKRNMEKKKAIGLVPANVDEFFECYTGGVSPKLQSVMTYAVEQQIRDTIHTPELLVTSEQRSRSVRFQAASARKASLWLTQYPSHELFIMFKHEYVLALRHRLGLMPTSDDRDKLKVECRLCHKTALSHDHYHSCPLLRGAQVTDRHRHVLDVIGMLVRLAKCRFWYEPQLYDLAKKRRKPRPHNYAPTEEQLLEDAWQGTRPDAIVTTPSKRYMIDVSVINPTSAAYIKSAAAIKQGWPEAREKSKKERYGDLPESMSCTFVPFVLDSYGAWGTEATSFLRALSDTAHMDDKKQREFM